jgi:hypothetical protein
MLCQPPPRDRGASLSTYGMVPGKVGPKVREREPGDDGEP